MYLCCEEGLTSFLASRLDITCMAAQPGCFCHLLGMSLIDSDEAQGEELVAMLEKDTLDTFLARVAAAHAGSTLGLLIEGLHSYLKCVPFSQLGQLCPPCLI